MISPWNHYVKFDEYKKEIYRPIEDVLPSANAHHDDTYSVGNSTFYVANPYVNQGIMDNLAEFGEQQWDAFKNCDFLSRMEVPSIETVLKIIDTLKPINFCNLMAQMATANSPTEKSAIVTAVLELYGLFWTEELVGMKSLLIIAATELIDFFIRGLWSDDRDAQSYHNQAKFTVASDSCVKLFLEAFDVHTPKNFGDSAMKILAAIVGVFVVITGGTIKSLKEFTVNKIIKRVNRFATSVKSCNTLIDGIPKLWTFVMTEVASLFGITYEDDTSIALVQFKKELLDFKIEVTDLVSVMNTAPIDLLMDGIRLNKCYTAMDRLDKLYADLLKQEKNMAATKPIFDDVRGSVTALKSFMDSMKEETSQKVEPFVLVLAGSAGIGKSQFVNWFVKKFRDALVSAYPEMEHLRPTTYVRNFADKFWSGYYGQMFVVYDDFGQDREDKDHTDLMSYKNPNRTHLNVSSDKEKGKNFTSFGVICCTNTSDVTASATVKSLQALQRRFEIDLLVSDPNMETFRAEHAVSPGKFEKETGKKAMIRDDKGNLVPYFDPNFAHLTFHRKISEDAERAHSKDIEPQTMAPHEIVELAMMYYQNYRDTYVKSMRPVTDIDTFNDADSSASDRKVNSYAEARASMFNDTVLAAAKDERVQKEFRAAVKRTTWKDVDETVAPPVLREKILTPRELEMQRMAERRRAEVRMVRKYEDVLRPLEGQIIQTQAQINHLDNLIAEEKQITDVLETLTFPAAENPFMHPQSIEEVTSTAKSFVTHEQRKGQIFALYGPPGTGKTTAMRQIETFLGQDKDQLQTLHANDIKNFVVRKPVVYLEDISVTRESFKLCRQHIMACYDGQSAAQTIFITFNEDMAKMHCETQEEWQAFYRRLTPYKFDFKIKQKNLFKKDEYYVAADVEMGLKPYNTMVCMQDIMETLRSGEPVYHDITNWCCMTAELIRNATDFSAFKKYVCASVPYIGKNQYETSFEIEIDMPVYEAFKMFYENPKTIITALSSRKIRLHKGSMFDGIKIANQFQGVSDVRPPYPATIEEFVIMINNSEFKSERPFVTEVKCVDKTIVIMPKKIDPTIIRCFVQTDHLTVLPHAIEDNAGNIARPTVATVEVFTDYKETVEAVAESLEHNLGVVDAAVENTRGFLKMFTDFPALRNLTRVLIFGMRIVAAGMSISTLIGMHKSRYDPYILEKKKGKNKRKQAIRNVANRDFTSWEYDDLKTSYDKYASSAARRRGLVNCIEDYNDIIDCDDLPIADGGWHQYLASYNESAFLRTLNVESGKEPGPKAEPAVAIIPELMIEKTEIPKIARKNDTVFTDESLLDPTSKTFVEISRGNTVDLGYCNSGGTFVRHVYGLMVVGRVGATVHHFVEEGNQMYARVYKGLTPTLYKIKMLKYSSTADLMIFEIDDKTCPIYPTILQHLPSSKNFKKEYETKLGIIATHERQDLVCNTLLRNVRFKTCEAIISSGQEKKVLSYSGYITGLNTTGAVNTQQGDCGSVLVANDTTIQKKLVGLHNSANGFMGGCTILFVEHFKDCAPIRNESYKRVSVPIKQHATPHRKVTTESLLGMPVVFETTELRHQPVKTKLWTSPLALPVENEFQPSVLSAYDPRYEDRETHPYFNAIAKWNHKQVDVDVPLIYECAEDIAYWYATTIANEGVTTKVLTKTEAINAGKQYELNPLNRQSSPGYPWNKYEKKIQNFLVDKGGINAYYGINMEKKSGQRLVAAVDEIINVCRTPGHYPQVAFAGNLKDEAVKLSKIKNVNTRSFAGAPLDYTIASRMYFATIQGAIHRVRHLMPVQIGIDPTSLEWDAMIKSMLSVSDKGFDLDFKGWDGTVHHKFTEALPIIYNTIAKATNCDWSPDDDLIRENLNRCTVRPNLVVTMSDKTLIVQAPGGMASGTPRTADDNSLLHLLKFYYCVKKVLRANKLESVANVHSLGKLIRCIIYGDDGAYAVHPSLLEFVNFTSIKQEFEKLNMQCTPASKDGTILEFQPVVDLEFLKRKTVKIGAHYYGALHKKTFQKMLGYCLGPAHVWHKERQVGKYTEFDLRQTAMAALQESIFHGKEFYESMKVHLDKCLRSIGMSEVLPRYYDMVSIRELPIPMSSSSK